MAVGDQLYRFQTEYLALNSTNVANSNWKTGSEDLDDDANIELGDIIAGVHLGWTLGSGTNVDFQFVTSNPGASSTYTVVVEDSLLSEEIIVPASQTGTPVTLYTIPGSPTGSTFGIPLLVIPRMRIRGRITGSPLTGTLNVYLHIFRPYVR